MARRVFKCATYHTLSRAEVIVIATKSEDREREGGREREIERERELEL